MKALRILVPAAVLLAAGASYAQEPVDIGGMTVARIREKGPYESLAARISQVEKWIADVISYENTKTPKVRLARKNGVLHVWCGDRPVIDIYPADAAATNMTEQGLGQLWMKNIKEALPRSTPVSKGGGAPPPGAGTPPTTPEVPRVPTGGVTVAANHTGGEPSTGLSGQAPGSSTQPSGEIVPAAPPDDTLPAPEKTPRSAALLMVLEALNMARMLPEDEYLAGRDVLASNLIGNLEPFMVEVRTAGEASGRPQPPRPPLPTVPPPTVPTTPTVTPTTPTSTPLPPAVGTGGSVVPRVPTVPSTPSVPVGPAVKPPVSAPPTGDPNTARVPQKQRIKRKFAAAQDPFFALKNAGDARADEAGRLLTESRSAFTDGDFDTSETKVDEALRLMGVPIPQ
ncbi:MAG: hypothetical protein FJX74_09725 [Armatimonadetes bacterium]|nr:hypothetical protein [Armatimonadota bacterium]